MGLLVAGCGSANYGMMLLEYGEFGPQVLAYKAIGKQWYQWENHGDCDGEAIDRIRVVVYRDVPLGTVRKRYPVAQETMQDFRYLEHAQAMRYLDQHIAEFTQEGEGFSFLRDLLARTRFRIVQALGMPAED